MPRPMFPRPINPMSMASIMPQFPVGRRSACSPDNGGTASSRGPDGRARQDLQLVFWIDWKIYHAVNLPSAQYISSS